MRSGSSAQDDGNWPPSQRPQFGGGMGDPARFGSGARNEPHDAPRGSGRREAPYGPEISWPYGFRPMDPESREVLESAYGTGPLNPGYGSGSVYQPQVLDDYGDPGYSDPSYDGPGYGRPAHPSGSGSAPSAGRFGAPRGFGDDRRATGPVPGYQVPDPPRVQDSPRSGYQSGGYQAPAPSADIWPVTGAQEALPDSGPRPSEGRHGYSRPGQPGYPEQWYDNPRLDDRAVDEPRSPDPRLEGITYGELRYDDTGSFAAANFDQDPEPVGDALDDESWFSELRRSAPAYPQNPQASRDPVPGSPISGPQRRMDPPGTGYGSSSGGYPQAPERAPGSGQPRWDGQGGPQLNAGRPGGRGAQGNQSPSGPNAPGSKPAAAAAPASAAPATGFLGAPVASVGLLTPPAGTRVDALRDGGALPAAPVTHATPRTSAASLTSAATAAPAAAAPKGPAPMAPDATRPIAAVRPGHGLDGPSITGSWPTQPATDDLESYDDFWRDDADEEYTGLFGDREAEFKRAAAKQAAAGKRQVGRRRGRSNDHRLWIGLGGVVVIAAAAIGGLVKFEFGSHQSGPAHTLATPAAIGDYTRTKDLEHQADVDALKAKLIQATGGQASNFVTAVYESGNAAAGNDAQIVMFVGAHLANADPAATIKAFTQQVKGAQIVSPGPGGGKAVCFQASNGEAQCAWLDNDSMGIVDSPSLKVSALAREMQAMRPSVELKAQS